MVDEFRMPDSSMAEQLIAESTGKNGTGVLPVVAGGDEDPEVAWPAADVTVARLVDADSEAAPSGDVASEVRVGGALGAQLLLWEVATAVAGEIGADRTGFRISPGNPFNDIVEGDTPALYRELVPQLAQLDLAYLHVMHGGDEDLLAWVRGAWPTALIVTHTASPSRTSPLRPAARISVRW